MKLNWIVGLIATAGTLITTGIAPFLGVVMGVTICIYLIAEETSSNKSGGKQ